MATRPDIVTGVFKKLQGLGATVAGHSIVARYMQAHPVKTEKGSTFHPALLRLDDRLIEIRVYSLNFVQVLSSNGIKPAVLKGCTSPENIVEEALKLHGIRI